MHRTRGRARYLLVGGFVLGMVGFALLAPTLLPGGGDPDTLQPGVAVDAVDARAWNDLRWEKARDPGGVLAGPLVQRIVRITVHADRLIAIGEADRGKPGAPQSFAAAWVSTDGHEWHAAEIADGVAPGDTASVHLVASAGEVVLAVGGVCCSAEEATAIWRSLDGFAWERVVVPAWMREIAILSVAGADDGFVAVGTTRDNQAAIAVSNDGAAWQAVDREAAGLGPGSTTGVAWSDRGWMAVGHQGNDPTWDGAVWTSPDLTNWTRVAGDDRELAGDDEIELTQVVPYAGGLLALGGRGTHADRIACERGIGQDITGVPGSTLAISCGWLDSAMWWSADGATWTERRMPEGAGTPIHFNAILPAGPGLIGVGPRRGMPDAGGDTIATWRSDDGSAWQPVGPVPAVAIGVSISDAIVVGRSIVAVGEFWTEADPNGSDAAIWIGTAPGT
jgi:hypothetical protein